MVDVACPPAVPLTYQVIVSAEASLTNAKCVQVVVETVAVDSSPFASQPFAPPTHA